MADFVTVTAAEVFASRLIDALPPLRNFQTVLLGNLETTLRGIRDAIEDAERRQVNDASIRHWFYELKDLSYDMEDVLDESTTLEIPQNKLLYCFRFGAVLHRRCLLHNKLDTLNERLSCIDAERKRSNFNFTQRLLHQQPHGQPEEQLRRPETASFHDVSKIYGRVEDKDILVSMLLCPGPGPGPGVVPVLGMGGMGKTTLAQLAYNDEKVRSHFDFIIWVSVSDPFDVVRISRAILEAVLGQAPEAVAFNLLQSRLCDSLRGKKFLLVLDDVWNEKPSLWDALKAPLDVGASGSWVLVTTRNQNVANMMRTTATITLRKLSEEDCWLIFSQIAFSGRLANECNQLETIGRKIVRKCQGLPLAAKTLGSLMRYKNTQEQWEDVLHNEMWEFEDVNANIFAPLLLSYFSLSYALRCCFSYCAIFPKDYVIERDNLIKLWMSQGYLDFSSERRKEIQGEECFLALAMRSFFQDFELDHRGTIVRCKMHDLVHDLAQFIRRYECFIAEVDGSTTEMKQLIEKARHSTLVLPFGAAFPDSISNGKSLRTLFLICPPNTAIDPKVFLHMRCIRTLNMSECCFKELPKEVGEFMHLRYLNLSGNNKLEVLPETLSDLYHLQTLLINDCMRLQRLPETIGKLINLRHLHIDWSFNLESLPKGIAELASLQTLDMVVVPHCDKDEAFQLGDLKRLNNLKGYLRICRCGNLESVSEAEKAELMNNKHLVDLNLDFDWSRERSRDDKVILEALRPHPYLESLEIRKYRGITMSPEWMTQLTNLRRLVLHSCQYCESLPPLGKLPSLESLEVCLMKSVKKVGVEFLGIETDAAEGSLMSSFVSFPNLRELRFNSLGKWKVWEGNAGSAVDGISFTIMPCLLSLEIESCICIDELPNFLKMTPVQNLTINECNILQEHCQMGTGKEWHKISHIQNIKVNLVNIRGDNL